MRILKHPLGICSLLALFGLLGPGFASLASVDPEEAVPADESALQPVLVDELHYDASISFIHAGDIVLTRWIHPDRYELLGTIETSAMLKPFFRWSGRVAAVGHRAEAQPESTAYFLDSINRKERREITLVDGERMTQYRSQRGWKENPAPLGTDIMSLLFLSLDCFAGSHTHDGEDSYPVQLRRRSTERVNLGSSNRYRGDALRCDYDGADLRGRERDVVVWLARPPGYAAPVPVQIRVSVPGAPAGVLKLRLTTPEARGSLAQAVAASSG
ncbi:MAG: DUF3108 domain-containing protein [Pseudomonadota bacterium]